MSLADIMNANGVIEIPTIITGSHQIKSGDALFTHTIDDITGLYSIVSNTNTKLLSFNQDGMTDDNSLSLLIQSEVNALLTLITDLQAEVTQLKTEAKNRIEAENKFIEAFKSAIYIEATPNSLTEFDYSDLL